MPDKFTFLSVDAFAKLDSYSKQAYLEKLKRYLDALLQAPAEDSEHIAKQPSATRADSLR